jgi:hypothetical protein
MKASANPSIRNVVFNKSDFYEFGRTPRIGPLRRQTVFPTRVLTVKQEEPVDTEDLIKRGASFL